MENHICGFFFWLGKKFVVFLLVRLKLRQEKASFLILFTNLHNLLRHRPWNTGSCTQPIKSELETAVKAVEITSFQGQIEAGLEHRNTHCDAKRESRALRFPSAKEEL